MDLLELLRASDAMTVQQIAEQMRVSRRTVLRDLESLRNRGWPIHGEAGPGGGIYLDRDRGMRAVHLALDEVAALWLASRLASSFSVLPWSRAARSGLDKVFSSLPDERQRRLRKLLRRVVVGRPATRRVVDELGEPPSELLAAFERAFADDECLAFRYTDRHGKKSRRSVEPHGLLVEPPAWYLLSRETENGEVRLFRMDRMSYVRVQEGKHFTPAFQELCANHPALKHISVSSA